MSATAGVLLPSRGDEAKAVEPNLPQSPLPARATVNPYQAAEPLATSESESEAIAMPQTLTVEAASQSVPTLALKPEDAKEEVRSLSNFDDSASSPWNGEENIDSLSQSSISPDAANAPLEKKHDSKVVATQLSEPIEKIEVEAVNSAPIELDAPQRQLNVAPITESSTSVQSQPATSVVPSQMAKTPGFVDSNGYNESVAIPVPPPETALNRDRTELSIDVPSPATALEESMEDSFEVEVQSTPEVENAAEPELIAPTAEIEADAEQTYQVQSGDTIDAIALRHGVSRSDIINANDLANPHQIQVAQELTIPQPQSVRSSGEQYETVIPGFSVVPNEEEGARKAQENAIANANSRESVVIPVQPWTSANATVPERPKPASEPVAVSVPSTEAQQQPDEEETTVVEASPNPYIERLKADIMRMREEYRAQRASQTERPEEAVRVAEAPSAQSVNTEWQSDRSRRSTPVETTASSLQVLSVQVRDNRSEVSKGTQAVGENGESNSEGATQVAVAPAPAVEYNRNTRPQTGIQVSPDLPPLAPDRYLPEQPAQFNGYIWPTTGVLTSGYGRRWGRMHRGIDVAGPTGTPIVAAASGEVVSAGWNSGGFGNLVDIRHADGSVTRYAHNSKVLVRKGQWVEQGERISLMGSTGYSTGPHLHFEVHPSGRGAVNPMALLPPR